MKFYHLPFIMFTKESAFPFELCTKTRAIRDIAFSPSVYLPFAKNFNLIQNIKYDIEFWNVIIQLLKRGFTENAISKKIEWHQPSWTKCFFGYSNRYRRGIFFISYWKTILCMQTSFFLHVIANPMTIREIHTRIFNIYRMHMSI